MTGKSLKRPAAAGRRGGGHGRTDLPFCSRLTLEYEGTRYRGWQIQKNARTVQGEIVAALKGIAGIGTFEFQGAGRTDAGVHALEQVAHLRTGVRPDPAATLRELNGRLPHDINVLAVRAVSRDFHARHGAVSRSYLYQISRRRSAFAKRHVWWVESPLREDHMLRAAKAMEGMHDFRSFTDADPSDRSTRVLIEGITLRFWGDLILVRVRGSHFIWKLVRRMVGVLVAAGRGELSPSSVPRLLEEESDAPRRLTAPPSGLFLERVFYRPGEADRELLPAFFWSLGGRSDGSR